MNLKHNQKKLENPLDRALLEYMYDRIGDWKARDQIMKRCGFDSPEEHPVGAYAQFHSSLLRVNREIAYRGLTIMQSEDGTEAYALVNAVEYHRAQTQS